MRVFHLDRLALCVPAIRDFFLWWDMHGPFPLTIPPDGGLRSSEKHQARLFEAGATKAKTLADTPHGRGAAADAYPAVLDRTGHYVTAIRIDTRDTRTQDMYRQYGEAAERAGLVWGGRWKSIVDLPHVETPSWRLLPFPPKSLEKPTP